MLTRVRVPRTTRVSWRGENPGSPVRVNATSQPGAVLRGVFQHPSRPPVAHHSMQDVRDAVEACQCVRDPSQRCQCYEVFGLDGRKVEAYYLPVTAMESTLTIDDETGRTIAGMGSFVFSMLLLSKIMA